MSAKISKEDTDRRKSCRFVLTALTRQGPHVASLLDGFAGPHQREDDPAPGFLGTVLAMARRLEAAIRRLLAAGAELYDADVELVVLRTLRDDVIKRLAAAVVRLRRKALADYVAPDLEGLALHSPRLYRADPLIRQVEMIDERFGRDDVEEYLGEPVDDDPADLRPAVARAMEIAEELREVLERIDQGRRRHDEAIIARDEARAEYDQLFVHTARTFEGFCRMAGLEELARRVRPSTRRPGRIDLPPDEEEDQPDAELHQETDESVHSESSTGVGQAAPDDSSIPIAPHRHGSEGPIPPAVHVDASGRLDHGNCEEHHGERAHYLEKLTYASRKPEEDDSR